MGNVFRLTKFACAFIAVIEALSLSAEGQSPSPANDLVKTSDVMLSRNVVVSLRTVAHVFPEISREVSTGHNLTAVANTKATRSVIYANDDESKKVTVTVDEYSTPNDASAAYQEAVAKSKNVPGFKPISAKSVGKNRFIGAVTQAEETHIGLGSLHGVLIVGATLAGYDPTPENIAKLISLTREEERISKAVMDRHK